MTRPDPVRQWAEARPDAPALAGAADWTWAELDAHVAAAAAVLAEGPERVAVRAETSPALVVLVLAALRARRLIVPLSTRWTTGAVADALRRLGIGQLMTDGDGDFGVDATRLASASCADLPVVPGGVADVAGGATASGPAPDLDGRQLWTVVHTSGSTGRPKPVVHTVDNHVWSARGVNERLGLGEGDRWLLDLPLYHVGGLGVVVRCVLAGATVAVPPPGLPARDHVAALQPTHASFVATQLRRLLDAGADLSGLRAVLLGGSAVPADLLDRALRQRVPVSVSYGMTEATATITATEPGDASGTSGRPLPHREVRISAAGEIEIGGPTVAAVLGGDGVRPLGPWHATGDLGRLDAQGRLVVTGRADLQFVSGGENVRPEPIEAALLALDGVAEAVVVPVSDAEWGARPVAWVRLVDGARLDPAALADALRQSLPGFMVPAAFHEWAGAGGLKPDRPALTREAERRAAG